jgi:hypothetical protein
MNSKLIVDFFLVECQLASWVVLVPLQVAGAIHSCTVTDTSMADHKEHDRHTSDHSKSMGQTSINDDDYCLLQKILRLESKVPRYL